MRTSRGSRCARCARPRRRDPAAARHAQPRIGGREGLRVCLVDFRCRQIASGVAPAGHQHAAIDQRGRRGADARLGKSRRQSRHAAGGRIEHFAVRGRRSRGRGATDDQDGALRQACGGMSRSRLRHRSSCRGCAHCRIEHFEVGAQFAVHDAARYQHAAIVQQRGRVAEACRQQLTGRAHGVRGRVIDQHRVGRGPIARRAADEKRTPIGQND